jgi:hypothetical protein
MRNDSVEVLNEELRKLNDVVYKFGAAVQQAGSQQNQQQNQGQDQGQNNDQGQDQGNDGNKKN